MRPSPTRWREPVRPGRSFARNFGDLRLDQRGQTLRHPHTRFLLFSTANLELGRVVTLRVAGRTAPARDGQKYCAAAWGCLPYLAIDRVGDDWFAYGRASLR